MELVDGLDRTFDHAHDVVGGIRPDQLSDPTPCTEWDVRALLAHTIGVVANIGARVMGETPAGPPDEFELDDDPARQFRAAADATLAAWRTPGVLERTVDGGAGPMPGRMLAGINLIDTATHSWDLARATGQVLAMEAACAQLALETARSTIVDEVRPGRFGPPVEVPADARDVDQLVAFLGRQP
jgi:uncharacterized protein (TIGR03086 family)